MASNHMVIDIKGWPEALFAITRACGDAIRREAESEADPRFARKLFEIAAQFEAGVIGEPMGAREMTDEERSQYHAMREKMIRAGHPVVDLTKFEPLIDVGANGDRWVVYRPAEFGAR
jgi:hypothetical protein